MSLGQALLRIIYPAHEAQRRELRRMIHEATACAEDISRTIRETQHLRIDQLTHPPKRVNGHKAPLCSHKQN
jgi:hypothetical protein